MGGRGSGSGKAGGGGGGGAAGEMAATKARIAALKPSDSTVDKASAANEALNSNYPGNRSDAYDALRMVSRGGQVYAEGDFGAGGSWIKTGRDTWRNAGFTQQGVSTVDAFSGAKSVLGIQRRARR